MTVILHISQTMSLDSITCVTIWLSTRNSLVQRGLHYAIIDEVDSVLIDEARTPLIISGQSGKSTRLYEACDILARQMKRGDDVPEYSQDGCHHGH